MGTRGRRSSRVVHQNVGFQRSRRLSRIRLLGIAYRELDQSITSQLGSVAKDVTSGASCS